MSEGLSAREQMGRWREEFAKREDEHNQRIAAGLTAMIEAHDEGDAGRLLIEAGRLMRYLATCQGGPLGYLRVLAEKPRELRELLGLTVEDS